MNVKAALCALLWYFCSLCTLFLNKMILSDPQGNVRFLSLVQMTTTCVLGAFKVFAKSKSKTQNISKEHSNTFSRSNIKLLLVLGLLRFATVSLGLFALSSISVSFTEAIKSTAPLFTVIFCWIFLQERTSMLEILSILPIMLGLFITSYTDLSFTFLGFMAAISNNCIDCIQNVLSKKIMLQSISAIELQFYTSLSAIMMQLPPTLYMYYSHFHGLPNGHLLLLISVNAVFYHLQSVSAYMTMSYISPVTMSVLNTLKRGLLIFLSVLYFRNEIRMVNALGILTIIVGVLLYSKAKTASNCPKDDEKKSIPEPHSHEAKDGCKV